MVWTGDHKFLFGREVKLRDLYQYIDGSRERGQCLDRIVESPNGVPALLFKVEQRALRDKLNNHLNGYISKRNKIYVEGSNNLKQLMLKRTWKKLKRLKRRETLQKKLGALQWKDCQRSEKGKVLKVVLNYLRKKCEILVVTHSISQ